jgi:hypothetical protein
MRQGVARFALCLPLLLCACPVMQQSPAARAQEAATEMNLNAKFGRMELAAERVAPKAKDTFFERHKGWGGKVRVADYELQGMRMKSDDTAEIMVRVAWFRIDEGDLRTTTLKQKWHDMKGDWKLVEESRIDGDVGLLGEPMPAAPVPTGPRHAQFPTIHIGTSGPGTSPEELPDTPAPAMTAPVQPAAETAPSQPAAAPSVATPAPKPAPKS